MRIDKIMRISMRMYANLFANNALGGEFVVDLFMNNIIYGDLCYKLNGIFFYIHNELGSCHKEKQYCDAFELKLKHDNYEYEREKDLKFELKEGKVSGNRCDFVIENKIAIDMKAKKYITHDDFRKMLRYLKAGKYKLGLIVNFKSQKVNIKRVVNSDI